MKRYKYRGESNPFISNGDIIEGNVVTWSVKRVNSEERDTIEVVYLNGVGFRGEDMPINIKNLEEVI